MVGWGTVFFVVVGSIIIILIALVMFFSKNFKLFFTSYPVKVIIFEKRLGAFSIRITRGRRLTEDNKVSYELKTPKESTKPLPYENLLLTKKGKSILFLFSPSEKEYYPVDILDQVLDPKTKKIRGIITPIPADLKRWISQDAKESYERYKAKRGLFDKVLPIVVIFLTALGIVMILYVALGDVSALIGALEHTAGSLKNITVVCQASPSPTPVSTPSPLLPPP